jgi:hypothetical protein
VPELGLFEQATDPESKSVAVTGTVHLFVDIPLFAVVVGPVHSSVRVELKPAFELAFGQVTAMEVYSVYDRGLLLGSELTCMLRLVLVAQLIPGMECSQAAWGPLIEVNLDFVLEW